MSRLDTTRATPLLATLRWALALTVVLAGGCEIQPFCLTCGDGGEDDAGGMDAALGDGSVPEDASDDAGLVDARADGCLDHELCNGLDDNCNGEIDEGFDLENDPDNCGGCGVACSDVNTPRACSEGRCVLTCEAPFESCDGDVLNGCETNVLTDRSHCGRCGNACTGNRSCCNGTCGNC
jgi:hypothetical protein